MIKGIAKTSLVDVPGKVCCTLFLGGCNFRCGYCYNSELVLRQNSLSDIPESEILEYLDTRKKHIEAVCITGGEPTLHPKLISLCRSLKKLGYYVKLDTNGTNPTMVAQLIKEKIVDYIAMDIKGPAKKYSEIAEAKVDLEKIQETIKLLIYESPDYEFRTTVIPDIASFEDMVEIGKLIKGANRIYLQQFRPTTSTINPAFSKKEPVPRERLESLKAGLEGFVKKVEIRA